jgi:anti-sigma factor ChrR (cupin superfamily)
MSPLLDESRCEQAEMVALYALNSLDPAESQALETHIASCVECQQECESLRSTAQSLAFWPTDVLRPSASLWGRLAQRIATDTNSTPVIPATRERFEPEWETVAPGISVKLLATDTVRDRVSMLVRLAPGGSYPAHIHAGAEELHLLDGELWINERKLSPGDYNRAEFGTGDQRVWSETGCTCVLITSSRDILSG